jgi:glycosyltransferase involved in cell wall biosynthesis
VKLSIVVICLNEERHLRRCLPALNRLDRCGLEAELIVVDSGSKDRSREVAREQGARVVECPRGIPLARNVGARHASGELLAYVDADVELVEGWYATVARALTAVPRKIVGAPPGLPDDASWVARAIEMHAVPPGLVPGQETGHDHLVSCHAMAMGREVFDAVGGFREDLAVNEDTHFVRQAKELGIPVVCDVGMRYLHHGEPRTLGEFFRRTVWGATYEKWFEFLRRGELRQARRPQYIFGAIVAAEAAALGLSLAAPLGGWQVGVPLSLAAFAATIGLPALRTAARHHAYDKLGQLALMFGTYGLANATALAGLGRDKNRRWR